MSSYSSGFDYSTQVYVSGEGWVDLGVYQKLFCGQKGCKPIATFGALDGDVKYTVPEMVCKRRTCSMLVNIVGAGVDIRVAESHPLYLAQGLAGKFGDSAVRCFRKDIPVEPLGNLRARVALGIIEEGTRFSKLGFVCFHPSRSTGHLLPGWVPLIDCSCTTVEFAGPLFTLVMPKGQCSVVAKRNGQIYVIDTEITSVLS